MGSSLARVMANIMTEQENKVIKSLINDGTTKFYCRYVDNTLDVVKPQDVSGIHKLLNSFDKNLKFTIDHLEMKYPIFSTWECHRMESQFTGRTLILGYMLIIKVLYLGFTVPHGLES